MHQSENIKIKLITIINKDEYSLYYADLYADDATFHTYSKDKQSIENYLQSDFNDSKYWSRCNKIPVHDQKTSCMALGTRHRLGGSHLLDIKSDDISIKQVSNQKLLGLYVCLIWA